MNIQTLLAFYSINSQAQFLDRNINEEIANSIIYVIDSFFVTHGTSFIIIMSCEREKTRHFYQDLSSILFGSYDNIKTQIAVNEEMSPGSSLAWVRMRIFNMLVVDSLKSFLNIDLANKVKNNDINEFYHIFLHNEDRFLQDDIKGILSYCWSNYIINVNIGIQTASGDIIVYTYFPFSESHCNKVIPVEINRFIDGVMVNAELYPQKLQNMHKCPIKVAPFHGPPYLALDCTKSSVEASISGFEGQLLKELSYLMNFTIEIISTKNVERGLIFSNYSTGAINMLVKRNVDMSLGSFWFTLNRSLILTASDSFFQTSNVAVLVKNSINYESPHLLWFPYEPEASVAIITSFIIMLIMAYILEKWSYFLPSIKPRNRCLNFIAWTIGLPSNTLPIQISKRIFVMTWILFGLVIRSQYAGIIFHLLRNNLFRRNPSTISEVVSLDYTVILNKELYDALMETSIFADTGLRYKTVDIEEHKGPLFNYLEKYPQKRFLVISPLGFLLHYLDENHKAGDLAVLKESFMLQNICIYFTKHSFLVDRVNFLIQRIQVSGLLRFWIRQTIDWSYLNSSEQPQEIVIGQRELKGIYFIWLTMMMVSFLVFCLETVSERFKFLKRVFN